MDDGLRDAEEVEKAFNVPVLAMVPSLRRSQTGGGDPSLIAVRRPFSLFGESIRAIGMTLRASNIDRPPRILLISSALPEEGKSTLAVSMARLAAQSGQNVLLIDCDLRRPSISKAMGIDGNAGLAELLVGEAKLDAVIHRDKESGMHFIRVAARAKFPVELLHSQKLRTLISDLLKFYDLVVLDTPPATIVNDALVLADIADAIILAVRWGVTKRALVGSALKKFRLANAQVTGLVLTRVNFARHATYGFREDSSPYFQKYLSS
jgi:capsular exopolysaccharide synthesis family protein